jgi:alpha-glucosidase
VAPRSVESKVTILIPRASGLTARRSELDGFAGTMTRLRGAYDAMNQTMPVSVPPDALIDAMQTGDRLSYHPDKATEEIAHLHEVLAKAEAAVATIGREFTQRSDAYVAAHNRGNWRVDEFESQKQSRFDAATRAQKLLADIGK